MMEQDIESTLIGKESLESRIEELANVINSDYAGTCPIFLGILKGCIPFMTALLNKINLYCTIEYMAVSSFQGGTSSTGKLKILKDIDGSVEGKDVIIIEDIIDSGITLNMVYKMLKDRGAKSVKIVTLLNKKVARKVNLQVDYSGFEIENEFVVGFGLDYQEMYRNLPYIGVLKDDAIKRQ